MNRKEPPDVAVLAARMQRAYPALSPYSCASLATELCAIERAQRKHAERCCSGEDGGYVRYQHSTISRNGPVAVHDPEAETAAGLRVVRRLLFWKQTLRNLAGLASDDTCATDLQGDPRGRVLLLRLPGEQEASTV